eukprot:m.238620 g.238620  ORF g.238620 m.238620 type:complete len:296 (-) comp21894_c0_seq1:67-954(-)
MAAHHSHESDWRALVGKKDIYGGLVLTSTNLHESQAKILDVPEKERRAALLSLLAFWEKNGVRGVWLRVEQSDILLLPTALELGFVLHHAQPGYIQLTKWLPRDEPNKLPRFAGTFVGVGGIAIDEEHGQVLVVQERFNPAAQFTWKFPGGMIDPGEDLAAAVLREVLEETGVQCEFRGVLGFRHLPEYRFGCSDLYFVALLRPLHREIKHDPGEIAACEWQPLDVFEKAETVSPLNKAAFQLARRAAAGHGSLVRTPMESLFGTPAVLYAHPHPEHHTAPAQSHTETHVRIDAV